MHVWGDTKNIHKIFVKILVMRSRVIHKLDAGNIKS